MPTKIYICFHENSRDLCQDCGGMSDLLVTSSLEDCIRWLINSIEVGKENKYLPIKNGEPFDTITSTVRGRDIRLTFCKDGNEDHSWNYDIVIKQFEYKKDKKTAEFQKLVPCSGKDV